MDWRAIIIAIVGVLVALHGFARLRSYRRGFGTVWESVLPIYPLIKNPTKIERIGLLYYSISSILGGGALVIIALMLILNSY